jgi:hypothetical protein
MAKKKSAIDNFDVDFSDVVSNAKNHAFSIIEQAPVETEIIQQYDDTAPATKKTEKPKKKSKNQYLSMDELIESGKRNTDVKYVRLTYETYALVQKVKNRFGNISIQDLVNTATYTACKQILEKR